jgi:hypothetical protein
MGLNKVTYQLAMAAGRDAGNRSAAAAGRKSWNIEDRNAAAAAFDRLFPERPELNNRRRFTPVY